MRHSATVLLATCLVLGGPSVIVAEEPPGESFGIGGHVRLPEHGFAMTVPHDWVWLRVGEPMPDELAQAMTRWSEAIVEHGVLLLTPAVPLGDSRPEICVVASFPHDSPGLTSKDFADAMTGPELAERRQEEGFGEASEPVIEWQDLPSGSTPRVDMTRRRATEPTPWASSTYFFVDPRAAHSLICSGEAVPDDHWRSIAEGFEFLFLPEPVAEWQRVEFTTAGVAFGLPSGWDVAVTPDDLDILELTSPHDGSPDCILMDMALWEFGSLDDIEAWLVSKSTGDPKGHTLSRLQLPIGEALMVRREEDLEWGDGDLKDRSRHLYIPTPDGYAWLECWSYYASGDEVEATALAIAEAFEFLAAQE